ncbi:MAG: hypothetical protein ACRDV9_03675 [Acidimicrobiia bacterium]
MVDVRMRWAVVVMAALLGALLLPGFARAAKEFKVFIDVDLNPKVITVEVGDSVVWVNDDIESHYIQGEGAKPDTGSIAPGDSSFPTLFDRAGEYRYFDAHNPADADLFGTVNVVAPTGPLPAPATTTTTRPPSTTSSTAPPSSTTTSTTTTSTTTTTAPPPARPRISGSTDDVQIPPASEAWRNVSGPYTPRPGDAPTQAPADSPPGDQVAAPTAEGTPVPGSEEASPPAPPKRSNAGLLIGGLLVLLAAGAALSGVGRSAIERARGR